MSQESKLRIHHLLNSFETGGAEMLVAAMAAAQMRAGHEVVVHAMSQEGAISEALGRAGVPFLCHLARHPLHRIWQVARSIRKDRPHVMHCHNLAPLIIGGAAARLAGIPLNVVTRHHPSKNGKSERKFWRAVRVNSCAKVIACSELVRSTMAHDEFYDRSKLTMIANGSGEPNCDANGEPLEEKRGVRLITVGRLVWEKDYPTLINAFAIARQTMPELELWIAGDGIERPKIEYAIAAAQLNDSGSVKMLGMKKNVGYYLKQSDIFVLSSVSEGLPVSQLEAMAVGLPIIVTDVGGMPDVVNQSGAGIVVPKSDTGALAEAIIKLAGDPGRRKAMGMKARAAYERDYTIERMCDDYERLYRECLSSPATPRHR